MRTIGIRRLVKYYCMDFFALSFYLRNAPMDAGVLI